MSNSIYYTPNLTEEQQEYMSQYSNICEGARHRIIDGYVERHHILPTCLGGSNIKENKVPLTAQEHFDVHFLLIKIFPNNSDLAFACHRMLYDKRGRKIKAEEYANFKIAHSKAMRDLHKGKTVLNDEGTARGTLLRTGRTKETHGYLKIMSEKRTGLNKNNCEFMAEMAKKLSNRTKETHQYLADVADQFRGRTKENHPGVAKMAEKQRGKTKENNVGTAIMAEKLTKIKEEHYEEIIYLREIKKMFFKDIAILLNETYELNVSWGTIRNTYLRAIKLREAD